MVNKKYTLSIIREARTDENRTPITPNQVQKLIKKFPFWDSGIFRIFLIWKKWEKTPGAVADVHLSFAARRSKNGARFQW